MKIDICGQDNSFESPIKRIIGRFQITGSVEEKNEVVVVVDKKNCLFLEKQILKLVNMLLDKIGLFEARKINKSNSINCVFY